MVHVTARVREILDHDGRLIEVLWLDANGEEYRTYIRQVDDPVDEVPQNAGKVAPLGLG